MQQVPGSIRRAEHFVHFLRRFLEFMRRRMSVQAVEQENPRAFLDRLQESVAIEGQRLWPLRPLFYVVNITRCPSSEPSTAVQPRRCASAMTASPR